MPSTVSTSSRANRVVRFAVTSTLVLFGTFFALLLSIRFIALPLAEARRGEIAQWLGGRIGQPVEIDRLVTGWDGWNPKLSIRGFRVRDRANPNATLLELPRVDLLVAWTSLPLLDLRLKELVIESPRLSLRRDGAGRLHVAGIETESETAVDDSAFADWLTRQPLVVVRDALVAWNDELRHAPQLLLDHVQFRVEQRFGHHRIGLTGVPPPELAAPLDLRADVTGKSLKDWQQLRGKLYLRLDYADVAAWREWLPLPVAMDSGRGAIRVWLDFAASQPVDVVADFELEGVRATLADKLPPLSLSHLAGRAQWKRAGARTELTATQVSFALPDHTALAPTDFKLGFDAATQTASGGGNVWFREIELGPLTAIAPSLPIPDAMRRDVVRYDARGTLRDGAIQWSGNADAPSSYSVNVGFRNLTLAAHDVLPGATNVTGSVEATQDHGQLRIASQTATVALPKIFAEPLAFDTVRGEVTWRHEADVVQMQVTDVAFANAELAGTAAATWHSRPGGPGDINLEARLTHANLAMAHRYLPVAAGAAVREWLRKALVKGTSNDAKITLAGDLAQFPFAQGKGGELVITFKGQDATLAYADNWPPVTNIAADVRVDGARLAITAASGQILGARVGPTQVAIADFHDAKPLLHVEGTATGPTSEFLAFVAGTPVAGWIGHVTDDATASGDGRLALAFDLPLRDAAATTIAGAYQFASNGVRLGSAPVLTAVNGTLRFTEHDARAADITAEAFGGPLTLQIATADGRARVTGAGTANLQLVRQQYDAPLLDRVTGTTDWRLVVDARGQDVAWTVESSLKGARVDLPAPVGKTADEPVPLRIERRAPRPREDRIAINYGRTGKLLMHRQITAQGASVDRALVLLGKAAADTAEPEQPGVWIRGDVASVNVDEWLAVDQAAGTAAAGGSADALSVNGVDLSAATVDLLGRRFTRVKSTARKQGTDWRLTLDGSDLAGTAVWHTATASQPNGRIVARLARFSLPANEADGSAATAAAPAASSAANRWPEVDLVADALHSKDRTLGKLEVRAQPSGTDWQIQKLVLANDAGRIDASGWWRNASAKSQTTLDVAVDVKEAGAFLATFGWPDAVKGAATKIDGQVSWIGAPSDFDYASLSGSFKLRAGPGQFMKADPGVGRLLGVLSLQALPRRISLDFRDVFSQGFAFDTVDADVRMQSGVMHTDDFRLVGPAAAVSIGGDVDLARETQQLKVRVRPSLSSGVSAGAAALFIANPLLGAAVGAGTLLAQKMLNNPFDQLFSYEYAVAGSWDDPVVTRVGARATTAAQSSPVER